jgi:hypothetical protein
LSREPVHHIERILAARLGGRLDGFDGLIEAKPVPRSCPSSRVSAQATTPPRSTAPTPSGLVPESF